MQIMRKYLLIDSGDTKSKIRSNFGCWLRSIIYPLDMCQYISKCGTWYISRAGTLVWDCSNEVIGVSSICRI